MTEPSKSELTRQRILTTGRALVLRGGFSGVGLSRILTESGVPKGSFYYYFPSKEDFGCAMLRDYVADYLARMDALAAGPGTGGDRLNRFWAAWLADTPDTPDTPDTSGGGIATRCLVVKLAAEIADLSDAMRQILDDGVTELTARLAGLLREGMADGSVRTLPDPDAAARTLYGSGPRS